MRRIRPLSAVLLIGALIATAWWWNRAQRGASPVNVVPASATSAATAVPAPGAAAQPARAAPAPVNANPSRLPAEFARLSYAQAWHSTLPPALAAFRDWAGRFLGTTNPAERTALEAEGIALAQTRRTEMKQLIERDPRAALEATVPAEIRAQLPAAIIAELETRFSVVAGFSVIAIDYNPMELIRRKQMGLNTESLQRFVQWEDDAETRAYVYGRREGQTTKNAIPLHGVLLDSVAALHESAMRVLEPRETTSPNRPLTTLPATGAPGGAAGATLAEIGGRLYQFGTADHLVRAENKLAAAESGIGPQRTAATDRLVLDQAGPALPSGNGTPPIEEAPATAWTTGNKKFLIIRVDFSDLPGDPGGGYTQSTVQNIADTQISPFFAQSSFGATTLTNTATPQVYRMPQTAVAYAAGNLNTQLHTAARNAAAANYTLADYERIMVLFSHLGGLPGSQITYGGRAQVGGPYSWCNGYFDFRVVAHEVGHTFGLFHANLWQVSDGNPVSAAGTSVEYADQFDTMGANYSNDSRTDLNPWFKNLLGWLADGKVQTITTTGTYRVNRFDNATGAGTPLALKIDRDATRRYWIGARRNFTNNPSMQRGAYVIWGFSSNQQSALLDLTTPGSDTGDAALGLNATLIDTVGNVSIKTVAEGGTAPNEYVDVLVTFGINSAPTISVQPQGQTFTVGSNITLSVTAAGTAPLSFVWRKDGNAIAGATTASYTITNAQTSHAGSYTVVVSNGLGSATSNPAALTVGAAAPQTITFGALAAKTFGDAAFGLTATASSGLTVSYASSNPAVATVSGSTVTIVGGGTTTITASQAGDANFAAATPVPQTLTVNKATATVTLGSLSPTYDATPKAATATTSPVGLTVTFTYDGGTTAPTNAGSYAVVGTISSTNYVGTASGTLTIAKATQTITFGALAAKTFGDAGFALTATASSGLTVSYASSNPAVATVSGSTVTIVGAGSTTITASQAGNGNYAAANNVNQTLAVTTAGNYSATQAVVGSGYIPGGSVAISNTITYTGNAIGLSWSAAIPSGWTYASSAGNAGDIQPAVGAMGTLNWTWTNVPASPVTFTYTLTVPAGETSARTITASAGATLTNGVTIAVPLTPASLTVQPIAIPRHSADTDSDGQISSTELTRVIDLFSTRNGATRTGAYAVATIATVDGFAPDPTRAPGATAVLTRYHAADYDRDGRISIIEFTRVIELYNYRNGTTRTGQYHVQAGTEDGFAPGP